MAKRELPIHMAVREGHDGVLHCRQTPSVHQVLGRARLRPHPKQGVCGRSSLRLYYLNQVTAGVVKDCHGDVGQFCRIHRKSYAQ